MQSKETLVRQYQIKNQIMKVLAPIVPSLRSIKHMVGSLRYKSENQRLTAASDDYIRQLHNFHKGQRCFVVGNGPSLQAEDLNKLKNEITFASNKIFKAFSVTAWRPTYYCVSDVTIKGMLTSAELAEIKGAKFFTVVDWLKPNVIEGVHYIRTASYTKAGRPPVFSDDILKGVGEGKTVAFICLQMAAYMGFKEIYLIGFDHNFSLTLTPNGQVARHEGVKDHFCDDDPLAELPDLTATTQAFAVAEEFAREHGFKIINATRGGKLEVFERVDFDSLFPNAGE